MPTCYLTRVVAFDATHRLGTVDIFGAAAAEHGHRYQCRVTVAGPVEPRRGGVMSLKALDALLEREVRAPLHQRSINDALPRFAQGDGGWIPTGEALAVYLWERLAGQLPAGVRLHAVRIQEDPHLYSEYFGEP
jgi:6-pyruvoyltetrahydropterin/6-carboxytetrahydropterin synthase